MSPYLCHSSVRSALLLGLVFLFDNRRRSCRKPTGSPPVWGGGKLSGDSAGTVRQVHAEVGQSAGRRRGGEDRTGK